MLIRCQVAYLYAKHYNTNANLGLGKCKLAISYKNIKLHGEKGRESPHS